MALDGELLGRELQRRWLDDVRHAVLLLDSRRRVLWLNRHGRALLDDGQVLMASEGVVQGRSAQAGAALEGAIRDLGRQALAGQGVADPPASRVLRLSRAAAPPMLAFLSLLSLDGLAAEPGFRLVACEPDGGIPESGLLARCFGFSPAEARVAVGLCEGLDVKRLARREGNSVNTIRSQVRGVLEKTRTTRQADLLRLLLSLPVRR